MKAYCILAVFSLFVFNVVFAGNTSVRGTVYDAYSGKPVEFAELIVVSAGVRIQTSEDGKYNISLPQGIHRITVTSPGLDTKTVMLEMSGDTLTYDFKLQPLSVTGKAITVTGTRKPQNISRRTMTFEKLEDVPGSFGDAVSALGTLPGINQSSLGAESGDMFGTLTVRGISSSHNRFFVDGIPIEYAQHFGEMHSVIANEFMDEIDVYSSAYPAMYNADYGAVVDIRSTDQVERAGGYVDIGFLSSLALVKTPIYTNVFDKGTGKRKSNGYLIMAGRVGYIPYTVPVYAREMGAYMDPSTLPQYWDYQMKFRHDFDSGRYLTLLFVGAGDEVRDFKEDDEVDTNSDPLFGKVKTSVNQQLFTQGATYTIRGSIIQNRLTGYVTIPKYYIKMSLLHPLVPQEISNTQIQSVPLTMTIKDEITVEWIRNMSWLGIGLEYSNYRFSSSGEKFRVKPDIDPGDFDTVSDIYTKSIFERVSLDRTVINNSIGARVDNRFEIGGLTLFPQIRVDYLDRNNAATVDPRGMVSFGFPSATTVSAASGKYHSFRQINPAFFNIAPETAAYGDKIRPEQSLQNVVGLEQKIGAFSLSAEIFYNYYYDLFVDCPYEYKGSYYPGKNNGEMKIYGMEYMIQKELETKSGDFFGWASYTWLQAKIRFDLDGEYSDIENNNRWLTSEYEIEHAVKIVGGYKNNSHSITGKFTWCTTLPFTEVVDGEEDLVYAEYERLNGRDGRRIVPVYSENENAKHRIPQHQLDLRYSYQTDYEWGYVKWYVEAIDIYQKFVRRSTYRWDYSKPYSKGTNPVHNREKPSPGGIPFIPNFGVEIKF